MNERRGAYGLTLPDFPTQHLLTPCGAEWPTWRFDTEPDDLGVDVNQFVSPDAALLALRPTGYATIDRRSMRTTVTQSPTPSDEAYVHPILVTTAAMAADWSGRLCFHAGSFLDDRGRAWGVLGDREQGKSSVMGWCASRGITVLSDDLVITDGVSVTAGPRCVDLRVGAAEHFGVGRDIGVVGTRRRWRTELPPCRESAPLAGWIDLAWHDTVSIDRMDIVARGTVLSRQRGLFVGQQHPIPWLRVLGMPALTFRRPKDWNCMDEAMEELLFTVAAIE